MSLIQAAVVPFGKMNLPNGPTTGGVALPVDGCGRPLKARPDSLTLQQALATMPCVVVAGSSAVQQWITQFRKGLVELCIMAALRHEEAYGYQIVEQLGRIPGLEVTESTVYPVLARLARDRCVTIRTAPSPAGPPRRYYRLSDAGRRRLNEMISHWQSIQNSVNQLTQGALT